MPLLAVLPNSVMSSVLQKYEAGKEVVKAMQALQAAGAVPKWGVLEGELQRRTVFLRQLTEARAPPDALCLGSLLCISDSPLM